LEPLELIGLPAPDVNDRDLGRPAVLTDVGMGQHYDGIAALKAALEPDRAPAPGFSLYLLFARVVCENPTTRKHTATGSIHTLDEALPFVMPSSHTTSHKPPRTSHDAPEENHDRRTFMGGTD
jgi:hypothetical protein